eukprot:gb/GECH01001786.1/.p1 GENE.gb/GECH01001786.1/~~gb/GECH01001786.1/.p1  ORF type:complete len:426 (+),score=67.87 gb/GECH01001786.1/:1-1278(+)
MSKNLNTSRGHPNNNNNPERSPSSLHHAKWLCVFNSHGIPLFARTASSAHSSSNPSWPTLSLLNALFQASSNGGKTLSSVACGEYEAAVTYQNYTSSGLLLFLMWKGQGVSPVLRDMTSHQLLSIVYDALILHLGHIDYHRAHTNYSNFGRMMRTISHFVDSALSLPGLAPNVLLFPSYPRVVVPQNVQSKLLQILTTLAASFDSHLMALTVDGKVVVSTDGWRRLPSREQALLSLEIASLPRVFARDVPVHLPNTSPNIPNRLLSVLLTSTIHVILLCGSRAQLSHLIRAATHSFCKDPTLIQSVLTCADRGLPPRVSLPVDVDAFLSISSERGFIVGGGPQSAIDQLMHLYAETQEQKGLDQKAPDSYTRTSNRSVCSVTRQVSASETVQTIVAFADPFTGPPSAIISTTEEIAEKITTCQRS